jgi:hypothetical protein
MAGLIASADTVSGCASTAFRQHALIGYLLTCLKTGAWPGSVQVPGPSLSFRLPALVVWLLSGLRGPGAVMGRERLKRGLPSSK